MSYRNGKAFRHFLYRSLFQNRGTNYRLTVKRLGVLLTALVIYLPAQLLIWAGLLLDEVFFPGFRKVNIKGPVFIIGNPRSGTTYLQRLLARDRANFTCMRTWEIFGSPSIVMRKLVGVALRIGRAIGVPITKRIRKMESLWKDSDRIHKLKLRSPEEDEYLFLHIFSTLKIWSFAAMVEESRPYIYYDQLMSRDDKRRIMDYYQSCLQRHYFFHGQFNKFYLSKNPNFTPAIKTLLERFPDAKFICLLRNPLDAVASHISLKEREWQMLGSPLYPYACKEFILESSQHWYDYPLQVLRELPPGRAVFVKCEDMTTNVERVVQDLYQELGLKLSKEFKDILVKETIRSRNYQSDHHYSLEEMGITQEQIQERFGELMFEFNYQAEKVISVR